MKAFMLSLFFVLNALAQNVIDLDQYINERRAQIKEQADTWVRTFLPRMNDEQLIAIATFLGSAEYLPQVEVRLHYALLKLQNVARVVQAELSHGNQFDLSTNYDLLFQDMKELLKGRNEILARRMQVMHNYKEDALFNDACQGVIRGTFNILQPMCAQVLNAFSKNIVDMLKQEESVKQVIEVSKEKLASMINLKNSLPDPMWFIDEGCGLINDMQQVRADAIYKWSPAVDFHCGMISTGSEIVRVYCLSMGEWLMANGCAEIFDNLE